MALFLKGSVSKFRNVNAEPLKKHSWYDGLSNLTCPNSDGSTGLATNEKYIAFASSLNGSTLSILPISSKGRLTSKSVITFNGHGSSPLSDIAFAPWSSTILASGSSESYVNVWSIPDDDSSVGSSDTNTSSSSTTSNKNIAAKLDGHDSAIATIRFHSSASGILATSTRKTVYVWDLENASTPLSKFGDVYKNSITDLSWNYMGNQLATISKDAKIRLVDPRSGSLCSEAESHPGLRAPRLVWAGNTDYFITTGFSNTKAREVALWDSRDLSSPISMTKIDTNTSVNIPFYDTDLNLLYLMGKGDTSVRLFELREGNLFKLNAVRDSVQHFGGAMLPKRALNSNRCEVGCLLRLTKTNIQPLSFRIPRKNAAREFQTDLYPDTAASEHAITGSEWIAGKDSSPKLMKIPPTIAVSTVVSSSRSITKSLPCSNNSSGGSTPVSASSPWNRGASLNISRASTPNSGRTGGVTPKLLTAPVVNLMQEKQLHQVRKKKFGAWLGTKLVYKHMRGMGTKKENAWYNATPNVNNSNSDSNGIAVSKTHFALPYKGSGGAVLVHPLNMPCKLLAGEPLLRGHTTDVQDIAFSPFNDLMLFTGDNKGYINTWKIPKNEISGDCGKLTRDMKVDDATNVLEGHLSSIKQLLPHPSANGVLYSTSMDGSVRAWDVEAGVEKACFDDIWSNNILYNITIKEDGSNMAVVARDKYLRVFDSRTGVVSSTHLAHDGAKAQRVVWCGNTNYIVTVGSDKGSKREVYVWDARKIGKGKVDSVIFGNGSGALIPLYDADTGVLFVGSRGDLGIKTYELHNSENDSKIHFTNEWKAESTQCEALPLLGMSLLPKVTCDIHKVEFARIMRLTATTIDPISFQLPRSKAMMEYFQDDIYPPMKTGLPGVSAEEWFTGGVNRLPPRTDACPAGKKRLSEKPAEEFEVSKSSIILKSIEKEKAIDDKSNEVFDKFTKLAKKRVDYHPNLSMGSKAAGLGDDTEVAEDEWGDDSD